MTVRALSLARFLPLAAALLGAAAPAFAAEPDARLGATYTSEDLDTKAPGPRWRLQTAIPGAPNVRGVYVFHRDAEKGRNRSSLLSFTFEPEPEPPEPAAYLAGVLEHLGQPPFSFKRGRGSELRVNGLPAYKLDYSDKDALRQFSQIAVKLPDGRLLLVALQSPDAKAFAEDLAALRGFLDGIRVRPANRPKTSAAPGPKKP